MAGPKSHITDGVTFLKVREVAAELGLSKMTVYRLVYDNHLFAIRIGRSYRIPVDAYRAFLDGAVYTPPQHPAA